MAHLPAICNNPACGTIFPSMVVMTDVQHIRFEGIESGPCPKCGGFGRIADGQYDVIAETIYASLDNDVDLQVLRKMQSIVESAIDSGDFSQAKAELEAVSPNWKNVFGLFPENNIMNSIAVYTFLLFALQTAIALYGAVTDEEPEKNTFIDQTFQTFYDSCPRGEQPEHPSENRPPRIKRLTQAIRNIQT